MLEPSCEEKIQRIASRIQEIEIEFENLDQFTKDLLKEFDIKFEQIQKFTAEKSNFTDVNWDQLQQQRKLMEDNIQQQLSQIKDIRKIKKAYADRRIEPHWVFVR